MYMIKVNRKILLYAFDKNMCSDFIKMSNYEISGGGHLCLMDTFSSHLKNNGIMSLSTYDIVSVRLSLHYLKISKWHLARLQC